MSKRLSSQELLACGYVNSIFEQGSASGDGSGKSFDSAKFMEKVLDEVEDRLTGGHLVPESLLGIKKLVQKGGFAGGVDELDRAAVEEVMGGLDKFASGVPQREFARLASGEKRHKL